MTTPEPDWERWYDAHAARLVLYARQWLPERADAEDAVQAGFVKFWRSRATPEAADLPLEQREAVVLRIWGGLTFAEAARTLGENINTVAARYRAALVRLRHLLPEACHEPDCHLPRRPARRSGAVAASLAFLLAGAVPAGREPAAVATVSVTEPAEPASPRPTRVRDEAVSWSDEGIRFVDEFTPARVLRRAVIERHLAGDGGAEVQVPREDVIFLPVALRCSFAIFLPGFFPGSPLPSF